MTTRKHMNAETMSNTTLAAAGQNTTALGVGATTAAWFTSNEFLGLAGLAVAVIGLIVNIYYKHKEDKRQRVKHDAEMAQITGGVNGK